MNSKVYIIILNWNGWKDTIECLNSVIKSDYFNYHILIVDNNSSDESLEKIENWQNSNVKVRSTLLRSNKNLGYSGGNNIGIRYALKREDFKYIWILNNDTVVKKDALSILIERMESDSRIGICGSQLMYYEFPNEVQALGGTYNKILGISKCITQEDELHKLDYIVGASMVVSKRFLEEIGLLNEEYFLYYEELDWAMRAKGKFRLACAVRSIVYHKEGASTGGGKKRKYRSEISDYYGIRNRILFTRKYFPFYLSTVYLGLLVSIFNRIKWERFDRVKMVLKLMISRGEYYRKE